MQLQQLRERRLDPEATEAQREEAGERMHELLAGRVLTTLHRPAIAYRFRGFSSFTISDPFPDGRCHPSLCPMHLHELWRFGRCSMRWRPAMHWHERCGTAAFPSRDVHIGQLMRRVTVGVLESLPPVLLPHACLRRASAHTRRYIFVLI